MGGNDRPGRVLGVDPGTVRVGLAVCDPDRLIATPFATLEAGRSIAATASAIVRAAADVDTRTLVVGLPKSLRGRDTESTRHARSLAKALEAHDLEVHLQDERLSSVQAERDLRAAGVSSRKSKPVKDQVAASVLLQAWLDRQR